MVASTLQRLLKELELINPHDDCYIFIRHFSKNLTPFFKNFILCRMIVTYLYDAFVTEEVMVKMHIVFLSKDVLCNYDNRLHKWERKPQYSIGEGFGGLTFSIFLGCTIGIE